MFTQIIFLYSSSALSADSLNSLANFQDVGIKLIYKGDLTFLNSLSAESKIEANIRELMQLNNLPVTNSKQCSSYNQGCLDHLKHTLNVTITGYRTPEPQDLYAINIRESLHEKTHLDSISLLVDKNPTLTPYIRQHRVITWSNAKLILCRPDKCAEEMYQFVDETTRQFLSEYREASKNLKLIESENALSSARIDPVGIAPN